MRDFIHEDFLLKTRTAQRLYHEFAEGLPVIDYHCHLDPCELADDRSFENLARAWIVSDPYKHRAMRIAGVPERLITGQATDREKFDCWAATVPQTLGNPLFHWTALELQRFFGVAELLSPATGDRVWEACNAALDRPEFTARQLIARANVECLCTSDRLLDDLQPHSLLAQSGFATRVLPSLRADDVVAVESPAYLPWLKQLGEATGMAIDCFEAFACAVARRLDAFDQLGCRLADHGLDDFSYVTAGENETAALFATRLGGDRLSPLENVQLKSGLCRFLGLQYARRNWSMQLHLGAHRRTSSRLRDLAGPAGGYAAMGPGCDIASLCRFLDDLERAGGLPRTVLYCLNPADNAALAVLTGSYAQDGVRGKIQFGPAWWYNDHASGIRQQLETAANFGLLSTFVGMTTDSRSLLSMTRHEYFRRVLCDFVGDQVEAGIWPADETLLGQAVRAVAYENARRWILSAET